MQLRTGRNRFSSNERFYLMLFFIYCGAAEWKFGGSILQSFSVFFYFIFYLIVINGANSLPVLNTGRRMWTSQCLAINLGNIHILLDCLEKKNNKQTNNKTKQKQRKLSKKILKLKTNKKTNKRKKTKQKQQI